MTKKALVFEVGESGFDRYVIENSHKVPVFVEFMGVWSEPCDVMAGVLVDLAKEFAEQFVFAKIDVDEQPGLRERFKVENVPTLMVFRNGEVALTQQGQLQADELYTLLRGVGVYSVADDLRQQARTKHMAGETPEAIMLLSQAIQKEPGNTRVAMDMVQIFLDIGELDQAKGLYNKLPERDQQGATGKSLAGQLTFTELAAKTAGVEVLSTRLESDEDDHDARFDIAVCLVARHNYTEAVDHLFTLFEKAPDYKDGAAKEMIITITNMLAQNEPELSSQIRQRLGSALNQ